MTKGEPKGEGDTEIEAIRDSMDSDVFAAYTTKEVEFRYCGIPLRLALSHGLFSSAGVDVGSVLLLKTLASLLDEDCVIGRPLPISILDAGCGVGVLGIAAAKALEAKGAAATVHAQDRDELARVFSSRNALRNGLASDRFEARAERLLSAPEGCRYALILSNLPAKAGRTVLADFFRRSARMLAEDGRCAVVIVNTLAADALLWMKESGTKVLRQEKGAEHTVFVYGPAQDSSKPNSLFHADPYERAESAHEMEGIRYSIKALHGVADFSEPSRAVVAAAKLVNKIGTFNRILVHECEQGHFPLFLVAAAQKDGRTAPDIVLCARNVLALEAAEMNLRLASHVPSASIPMADLGICADAVMAGGRGFDLVASFPEMVPKTDRAMDFWAGAERLTAPGGLFLVSAASTEAARIDRHKSSSFSRAGDLKRDGFRALAYRKKEING